MNIAPALTYTGQFMLTVWQDIENALTGGSSGTFGSGNQFRESLSSAHTDFTYDSNGYVGNGKFIVTGDSHEGSTSWLQLKDRQAPDSGYFLLGNATGSEKVLFKESLTGLGENTTHHISAFVANVHSSEMAELSFRVNGTEVFSTGLIDASSDWQEFGGSYTTGVVDTSPTFEIVSVGDGIVALDDVLFSASYEDDMLVTVHDAAYQDSPLYYNFTFVNNNAVSMTVNFVDTLPSGLTWDPEYAPIVEGVEAPTPSYSDNMTTISYTGLELPPGESSLSIRTAPTTSVGDYSNEATVTVADEDFLSETFTSEATFTVISGG